MGTNRTHLKLSYCSILNVPGVLYLTTAICIFLLIPIMSAAQCANEIGANDLTCGDIQPSITLSNPLFCAQSTDTFQLHSVFGADRVTVCFGDGTPDAIIFNPDTSFMVIHSYNLPPIDSCPAKFSAHPYITFLVVATFYKTCSNGQTVRYAIQNITCQFKPRVRFPYHDLIFCHDGSCVLLPIDTFSCTNSNTGNGATNYLWDYGDGDSGNITNAPNDGSGFQIPCHSYTASTGYYLFKLSASNQCGTESDSIRIHTQNISAVQIAANGHRCVGDVINFNISGNNGGDNAASFYTTVYPTTGVTINNAHSSTPSIIFDSAGSYQVSFHYGSCLVDSILTIEEGVSMDTSYIPNQCFTHNNVIELPNYFAGSSATQTNIFTISDSLGIVFQDTTIGVPSGSISLNHTGPYNVTLVANSVCNSRIYSQTFYVLPQMFLALPSDTTLCLQQFYSLPTFQNAFITLDNAIVSNPNFYIDSSKVFPFVYHPECGNSAILEITGIGVKAEGLDSAICFTPGTLILSSVPMNCSFNGSFINGSSFDITMAGPGQHLYTVTYYDSNSTCTYIDTSEIRIYPLIQYHYTMTDTVCVGGIASFIDSDISHAINVFWGDSSSSFGQGTLNHVYSKSGTLYVDILITDTLGCTIEIQDSIVTLTLPSASFAIQDSICGNTMLTPALNTFFDSTYNYLWLLGIDTLNSPSVNIHNLTKGIIDSSLTLFIISPQCGVDSESVEFHILPETRALFGFKDHPYCNPVPIEFINNSSGFNLNYRWYLQDSLFSFDSIPSPLILTTDTLDRVYNFKLIACSPNCLCDTAIYNITVHPVNFRICFDPVDTIVCVGEPIIFKNYCNPVECSILYHFGDGASTFSFIDTPVVHIYTEADTFNVWLIANCSCNLDSIAHQVIIKPRPKIDAVSSYIGCAFDTISYAINYDGFNPMAYTWFFGDGETSNFAKPDHIYKDPGHYFGGLQIIGNNACLSDTFFFSTDIKPLPDAQILADTFLCQNKIVQIRANNPKPDVLYNWVIRRMADTPVISISTSGFYFNTSDTGTFILNMVAASANYPYCKNESFNTYINVMPSPQASFSTIPERGNVQTEFEFRNKSTRSLGYWWDFGTNDSLHTNATNPIYNYSQPGLYKITLVAINGLCVDTAYGAAIVDPLLQFYIPNVFSPNGDGNNDYFDLRGALDGAYGFRILIFNRIGEKVFESNNINFKWDGYYKGNLVGPGVYIYEIEVTSLSGDGEVGNKYKGSLTVLR